MSSLYELRNATATPYVAKRIAEYTDAPAEWYAVVEEFMRARRDSGCLDDITAEAMGELAREAWAELEALLASGVL